MSPRIFIALAWKELRESLPLVVLALLGDVALRIGLTFFEHELTTIYVGPFLFALGFGAVSFGGERETGTLSWLQSLPLNWATALLAKLAIGIAVLTAIFGYVLALSGRSAFDPLATPPLVVYFAALHVLLSVSLACVVIRDTLWGILIGAAISIVVHSATVLQAVETGVLVLPNRYLITSLQFLLIALVVCYWAQWKSAGLRIGWRFARREEATCWSEPSWSYNVRAPQRWDSLLWQAGRQTSIAVLTVLLAATTLGVLLPMLEVYLLRDVPADAQGAILFIFCGVLGISCFAGDSKKCRFRFLDQLPVFAFEIWLSRIAIPAVAAALIGVGAMVGFQGWFDASMISTYGFGGWSSTSMWSSTKIWIVVIAGFAAGQLISFSVHNGALWVICLCVYGILLAVIMTRYFPWHADQVFRYMLWGSIVLLLSTCVLMRTWLSSPRGVGAVLIGAVFTLMFLAAVR